MTCGKKALTFCGFFFSPGNLNLSLINLLCARGLRGEEINTGAIVIGIKGENMIQLSSNLEIINMHMNVTLFVFVFVLVPSKKVILLLGRLNRAGKNVRLTEINK